LLGLSCGAFAPDLQAQGTQRSTRSASSSETNSAEIFRTLKGLDDQQDGLKQLDDELSKSLRPFTTRQSVDPALPSSYQAPRLPVAKSRRAKEELEKSRGWVWDAEAATSGDSREDSSLFPGFTSKSSMDTKRSSWDQYSNKARPDRADNSGSHSSNQSNARSSDDDKDLPGGIGEAAKSLKRRLEAESVGSIFNPPPSRSVVLDFFGQPVDNGPTPAQVQAHKTYMDEYQKIIGGSTPESVANQNFFKSASVPTARNQGLDSLPGSSRSDGLAFTPGAASSVLAPATIPDVNATILNQWNPLYSPPKIDLPKPAPFFSPPAEIPRRKF
jgi:hypothetical protein